MSVPAFVVHLQRERERERERERGVVVWKNIFRVSVVIVVFLFTVSRLWYEEVVFFRKTCD